jgi:hypothetical protein
MKFQIKGFTSLLLTAVFLILGLSGIILYLTPRGRVANWTGWTMLGLEKQGWQAVHINIAILFLIVAGLHLYLNWSIFWCYIKKQRSLSLNIKLETLMALLLAGVVLAGAITGIPPFSTVVDLNYQIKDYWERWALEAPAPHAEELSLNQFADNMGLSASNVTKALQEEGIVVADTSATIRQVAEANGLTPADVYAAIKKHYPESDQRGKGQGKGRGMGQGQGRGRGMGKGMGRGQGMGWRSEE